MSTFQARPTGSGFMNALRPSICHLTRGHKVFFAVQCPHFQTRQTEGSGANVTERNLDAEIGWSEGVDRLGLRFWCPLLAFADLTQKWTLSPSRVTRTTKSPRTLALELCLARDTTKSPWAMCP